MGKWYAGMELQSHTRTSIGFFYPTGTLVMGTIAIPSYATGQCTVQASKAYIAHQKTKRKGKT
jgi:hypothetical protein